MFRKGFVRRIKTTKIELEPQLPDETCVIPAPLYNSTTTKQKFKPTNIFFHACWRNSIYMYNNIRIPYRSETEHNPKS